MRAESALRVAAVQLNSGALLAENLQSCESLVARAATAGADLVVLPENFAYSGDERTKSALAERLGDSSSPIQGALVRIAQTHGVVLVGGGFPEQSLDPARPYNTAVVVGPDARVIAKYRKCHLFDVITPDGAEYAESRSTTPGHELTVVEIRGVPVGLSICYDLRFPELYGGLVRRGAEIVLVPAAFTQATGKDHWHVLLRARAIECLVWVVAAAQWGSHPGGRVSYGHSLIVDPWGTVVAECSDRVGLVVAELDLEMVHQLRRRLPVLQHRTERE